MPLAFRRRPGRLFLRMGMTLGAALTLAFALAAGLSIAFGARVLGQSVDEELAGVPTLARLELERFLAARRAELQLCSGVEAMDDVVLGDTHFRIENAVMRLARTYPEIYDEIAVVGLDGGVIASTRVDRIGTRLPIESLHLVDSGPDTRIGEGPQEVAPATAPVLVLARDVRSSLSRARSAWIVALVRWGAVREIVEGTSVAGRSQRPGEFLMLLRGEEPIAGHAEWLPGHVAHDARNLVRNRLTARTGPAARAAAEHQSFVPLTSQVPSPGWQVVFYRDAGEAFAPIRLFAWGVLAAGVLGLLLAAGLSLRAAGEFTRRVDALREGTQRLASGDYSHRVHDDRGDELSQLGESFNRMADATQQAREAIEASNSELEESNRRLREASRLKDEFLANTSHELRTPLNGILGFLELVDDGLCDNREEEARFVRQALECGRNLCTLVEDVLDVSRIEAGRLAVTAGKVLAQDALAQAVKHMAPRAMARNLELHAESVSDSALAVRADPQRLQQVLRHLVDNAIKFTHAGTVTLACRAPEGSGHARFEVRDTGVGIAPERRKDVFLRFVQGDGSATREHGGTGLGLSLVADLVGLMGGVVDIASAGVGRGTTASFTLPLAGGGDSQAIAREALAKGPIQGPHGGPLALVVEDDPEFLAWLRAMLHGAGIRTAAADSAERAWMLLHQLRPQVVLLDHALPAGPGARFRSGLELARHMAQIGPAQSTPALLLTGHDLAAIAGPDAVPPGTPCLRKPVPREVLLAEVRLRLAMAPPRPVQVMLAHGDPAWRAVAANLAADTRLAFAFEANNASCIETLRLRARAFDAVVLESPATAAELSDLLRSLRALESVPPLLVLADAALQAHAGLWAELREPPVTGVLPRSPLLADPSHLRARLLALGSAEDPSAGRAAA